MQLSKKAEIELARIQLKPFVFGNAVAFSQYPPRQAFTQVAVGQRMQASMRQLGRHMVVMGTTGSGKSKFLEHFGRHLIAHGHGFTFIDPHGDTVEDLMAFLARDAERNGTDCSEYVHYLEPSTSKLFSFDPFMIETDDSTSLEQQSLEFKNEVHIAAEKLAAALNRGYSIADQQLMKRRARWMQTIFKAVATPLNDAGEHLPLGDIWVLLDQRHPRHPDVYRAIEPRLPPEVRRDFELLHTLEKRKRDEDNYIESTENLFRDFFSELVQSIFLNEAENLPVGDIIRNRHILLVNLRASRISESQGSAIASLLMNRIVHECSRRVEKGERVRHHLIIDEAGYYLGEDFRLILERARKWGLSLCLGGQSFSTFQQGEINIVGDLQGLCHTFVSFQQRNVKPDVEQLGKFFAYPNRNHEERMSIVDRPDGHDLVTLTDISEGTSTGHILSQLESEAQSIGYAQGRQHSRQQAEAIAQAKQLGVGSASTTGKAHSSNIGQSSGVMHRPGGITQQHFYNDGMMVSLPVQMEGQSSFSNQRTITDGYSTSQSDTDSSFESESQSVARMRGSGSGISEVESRADIVGTGRGESFVESKSHSVTHKKQLVPRHREELHPTGSPRYDLTFQDDVFQTLLTTLPDQYAFVRFKTDQGDRSMVFRTADVHSPFDDEDKQNRKRTALTKKILASKPYIFTPSDPHATQDARIDRLLCESEEKRESPPPSKSHGETTPGDEQNPFGL